ncbi:MAG: type II toxin-antitoxin system RelE/ParE family toxin [Thermoanaerobaculia bacterium]
MAVVRLSSHARKSYLRLARSDRRLWTRVDRALDRLAENPEIGKPLAGPLRHHRSHRVGPLRIVYRIESNGDLSVLVLEIAQRGHAYRRA